jgi:two-component sensor histidine kinase
MAVTLELDSRPEAANCARDEIRHRLRGRLDDGPLLDLQLIVSELVTNSLRYGPGGTIRVDIALADDGSIRGEVADCGSGDVAIRAIADDSGGFGLRIVASLADRWGVYEDSTRVWFEMSSPRAR